MFVFSIAYNKIKKQKKKREHFPTLRVLIGDNLIVKYTGYCICCIQYRHEYLSYPTLPPRGFVRYIPVGGEPV